ncbi:MAG TPA: tetratricopeptide repeat protein [Chthoniobacterales bacterium]|nr:tetratricopeptide repeat protein [Chthoniobacterales bacterium]
MQNKKKKRTGDRVWIVIGICAVLVGLIWLVFGQTLGHGFVYDDELYVLNNSVVKSGITLRGLEWAFTHSHASNWHPLTTISHMLDCQIFGLNAGGHHFTNVLLQTVATLLLFFALRQLTGELWRSAVVAALFAVHPLRVESVAWIAERKDLLSGVFFILTLSAYVRYARQPTLNRYIAMAVLFVLGLMSKPMLVTLPFVLLLLDYWPLKRLQSDRQSLGRLILEKIPLFILAAGSCVVTLVVQSQEVNRLNNPLKLQVLNGLLSYVTYLWEMVWPTKLAVFYPLPSANELTISKLVLAIIFLITVSGIAIALRRTYPYLITGWLWYVGMLVPVIGLVQVGWQSHADRYTYLPQVGIYLGLTWAIADLSKSWRYRRELLGTSVAIVLTALSWTAWTQTRYWRDTGTLWRRALAVTSNNYIAHHNLGFFLGKGDEAVAHFEEAIRLQPNYASAHHNLGRNFLDRGEIDKAISHFQIALSIEPQNAQLCTDLGNAFLLKGEARKTILYYDRALQLAPEAASTLNNLAWVFSTCTDDSLRDGARAVQLSQKAVELSQGQDPTLLRTLAAALAETGRFNEAIQISQRALQLAIAQNNSRLANRLRTDVDLYETKLPCRDPSLTNQR